jgi:tripartite-type tricarboxylate transporter receptor subunit TctC
MIPTLVHRSSSDTIAVAPGISRRLALKYLVSGGALFLATACGRLPAEQGVVAAGDAAEFYRGKTVRLVVGFGPGTSHDTYARVLGKYLGRYISGNPGVAVDNHVGSGSAVALSEVAGKLPRDGTVIGLGDGSLLLNQITGARTNDLDLSGLSFLGSISTVGVVYVSSPAALERRGVNNLTDHLGPQGRELQIGEAPGPGGIASRVMESVTGARIRRTLSAAGAAQLEAALEAGEIDAYFDVWDARGGEAPPQFKEGKRVALLIASAVDLSELDHLPYRVPRLRELAATDENRALVDITTLGISLYHAVLLAPGVPAERLTALQEAFRAMLQNDDVRSAASYAGIGLTPGGETGAAQLDVAKRILSAPESVRTRLQRIMTAQDRPAS